MSTYNELTKLLDTRPRTYVGKVIQTSDRGAYVQTQYGTKLLQNSAAFDLQINDKVTVRNDTIVGRSRRRRKGIIVRV